MSSHGSHPKAAEHDVATANVPEGFVALDGVYGFMGWVGPLYLRRDAEGETLGLRVEPRHCNLGRVAHGGMIAALADIAIGHRLVNSRRPRMWSLSLSLTTDFMGAAALGSWLEACATLRRVGSKIAFVDCELTADGEPIGSASSVLKILSDHRGRDERVKSRLSGGSSAE